MLLESLKNHLKNNSIQPIYLFTGVEHRVIETYCQRVANNRKTPLIRAESMSMVYKDITKKGFMSQPITFVVTNDEEFETDHKAQLLVKEALKDSLYNLILVYTKLDKRTKLYKEFKDCTVEFKHLPESAFVSKGGQLGLVPEHSKYLMEVCGRLYRPFELELDKLINYANHQRISPEEAFITLCENRAFWKIPEDRIFDLVAAVCKNQRERAWKLLAECKEAGTNPLAFISVLYQNIRSTIFVQSGSTTDYLYTCGLTAFQVTQARKFTGTYTEEILIKMLKQTYEMEGMVKSGKIDVKYAMDVLLINLWRG